MSETTDLRQRFRWLLLLLNSLKLLLDMTSSSIREHQTLLSSLERCEKGHHVTATYTRSSF